jgi:tetratricopeptide (TPR) repeat protein
LIDKIDSLLRSDDKVADSTRVKFNYLRGTAALYRSRNNIAEQYLKLVISDTSGWKSDLIMERAFNNLGITYFKKNQLTEALYAYQQSLRLAERESIPRPSYRVG